MNTALQAVIVIVVGIGVAVSGQVLVRRVGSLMFAVAVLVVSALAVVSMVVRGRVVIAA